MKMQMIIEVPDDFTDAEITKYQGHMATIAGYYAEDILKDRNSDIKKTVKESVTFAPIKPSDESQ